MPAYLCKNVHKTIRLTTPKDEHKKPGDEKICHEPTDTPSKITPSRTDKSDPARTSLHGIPTESNLEMCPKCQGCMMKTERSGNFNTKQNNQPHQWMNTPN
jgi:hypothetical protein